MTTYAEAQEELVQKLIATQSYKDNNPFSTYYKRREDFEEFLFSSECLPCCGCGNPEATIKKALDALTYCSLNGLDERTSFLQEKFGVDYVSNDGLVQLLFYVLDDNGYIEHGGSVNGSWLTDAGKILKALMENHFNDECDADQILNWDFDIDFKAIRATN